MEETEREEEEKFFPLKVEMVWRTFACKTCGDTKTLWMAVRLYPDATRHTRFCPACRKIMPYREIDAKPPEQS